MQQHLALGEAACPELFEPVVGVLPLHDDAVEATRQQEGDQPVVRVEFGCLPEGGALLAQGQGAGAPQLAKVQPSRLAQIRQPLQPLPAIGFARPGAMAQQHETGAPVGGREAGKLLPLRGLQGAHGHIQLLVLHEMQGPGPGEVAKHGVKARIMEDLAGQGHVQSTQGTVGVDLAEGGPVAPGYRHRLPGAERQAQE